MQLIPRQPVEAISFCVLCVRHAGDSICYDQRVLTCFPLVNRHRLSIPPLRAPPKPVAAAALVPEH